MPITDSIVSRQRKNLRILFAFATLCFWYYNNVYEFVPSKLIHANASGTGKFMPENNNMMNGAPSSLNNTMDGIDINNCKNSATVSTAWFVRSDFRHGARPSYKSEEVIGILQTYLHITIRNHNPWPQFYLPSYGSIFGGTNITERIHISTEARELGISVEWSEQHYSKLFGWAPCSSVLCLYGPWYCFSPGCPRCFIVLRGFASLLPTL